MHVTGLSFDLNCTEVWINLNLRAETNFALNKSCPGDKLEGYFVQPQARWLDLKCF